MSFLVPLLTTLGSTLIPKALSWVGRKMSGNPIGNIASHMAKNYNFQ